jgi:cytochrome c peroxidase
LPTAPSDADFYYTGEDTGARFRLGQSLFFDKLLSGNRNISCATCHHPDQHTGDGLSLSLGEGGLGRGQDRTPGQFPSEVFERVGRNATPLFNLGAREYIRMFHDGRVEVDPENPRHFLTPAGDELPGGLDNVLAAQAMMPVVSPVEMAGQHGENPVGTAVALGDFSAAWGVLAQRLQDPGNGYVEQFKDAFPDIDSAGDISYVHAANAIAVFQAVAWRADDSPFDRYLRGRRDALTAEQKAGMELFYGAARCSTCHSGTFLTDHKFHSVGIPQIGPGKGNGFDGREDFGREQVTGRRVDRYKFRTPALRNVALSGPWGHNGAFDSLEAIVRHHLDAVTGMQAYDPAVRVLPPRSDLDALDLLVHRDPQRRSAIAASSDLPAIPLSDGQIAALVAFLEALTDPASVDLSDDIPEQVASGLSLED